jgi:uncharacterized lipoprotein YajG
MDPQSVISRPHAVWFPDWAEVTPLKTTPSMKTSTTILVAFAAFLLSGCATSYQSNGSTGGYSETQLAPDVFRVAFRGNRYTSPEQAQDFCMLRAAELALQQGFTHLALVDERSSTTTHSVTTAGQATTTGTAYKTHTFKFFKAKPDGVFTFDAALLQQFIKQTYKIK